MSVANAKAYKLFPLFLDKSWLVRFGLREIAFGVLVEISPHAFAVLQQQPAIDDLEGVHVYLDQFSFRDTVGAVAAEYGFIFGRVALEQFAVLFRGEIVKRAVVSCGKLRLALHRLVVGKKCDRVVALDGDAGPVEIEEGFGLG